MVWESAVSSPSGVWAKPQPTDDLVHIGVKKCSSAGSSFRWFSQEQCNFLHKTSLISYVGSNSSHRAAPYEEFFSWGSRHHCPAYGSRRLYMYSLHCDNDEWQFRNDFIVQFRFPFPLLYTRRIWTVVREYKSEPAITDLLSVQC